MENRKTSEQTALTQERSRAQTIIRTSITGILANLFLASFKTAVGLISHSIAVILDAVNNISDAASSLITIVGTRLAGKEPDKKHPFGHGRVEYLSAMIISVIVLYAGITSFVESVKKIIEPDTPDYSVVSLVIIAVAVVVKLVLGRYVKSVGEKVNSDSLINSGTDATLDAVISASTLAAALLFVTLGISLEAWLGAVISLVIIKSGVEMLREAISKILGEGSDYEQALAVKETVASFPSVDGAYDLIINDYGPDIHTASVHIEVPDTLTAEEIDRLQRQIAEEVYRRHGVAMTAIGVYAVNTHDPRVVEMRENIRAAVLKLPHVLQIHGFYADPEKKTARFDAVLSFDSGSREESYRAIMETAQDLYPDYRFSLVVDRDFGEK